MVNHTELSHPQGFFYFMAEAIQSVRVMVQVVVLSRVKLMAKNVIVGII